MTVDAQLDVTHDPALRSWVPSAGGGDFPVQNLPFGVVVDRRGDVDTDRPRGVVRIGDEVLDLGGLADSGLLGGKAQDAASVASRERLNDLFSLGAGPRRQLRLALHALLVEGSPHQDQVAEFLTPVSEVVTVLPAQIGDYTDFYVGIHHATTVGALFRPDTPLLPNYKWLPIGYHGRSSSIRVSGTPFLRPTGQVLPAGARQPVFAPSAKLDYELELGVWVGPSSRLGEPVGIDEAAAHVSGYCLLNDWSARDIQAWEYQPLGPFLAKNFASTVSPWVVTPEALAPFRAPSRRPDGDPRLLPHLDSADNQQQGGLDVELEVLLSTARMRDAGDKPVSVSTSSTQHMYWSVGQMVAHHTSNGCDLRSGDLLGSGTLSGPTRGTEGSLLEQTLGGRHPVTLPNGEVRSFVEDGDEVILRGRSRRDGAATIGFGDCVARVQASPGAWETPHGGTG